ncbi:hypothetical protein V8C40DRAFT_165629 [Trichoderma camerunense]
MDSTLGPYSKVVALTQGMINQGLKDLHGLYSALRALNYREEKDRWNISLVFDSPRLMIHGYGEAYLLVRVKNGQIQIGKDLPIALDGWKIYHQINPDILTEPRPSLPVFDVSIQQGDVSTERVLAALLASPCDGLYIHPQLSTCRDFNPSTSSYTNVTWQEWSTKYSQSADKLQEVFRDWPRKLKDLGYNFMGLQFRLGQKQPPAASTVREVRRVFIYRDITKKQDIAPGNNYNSILVCTSSGDDEEPAKTFDDAVFTRSYVSEALFSPDAESLNGFWTMNATQILELSVLPQFKLINQAAELQIEPAAWSTASDGKQSYSLIYQPKHDFSLAKESTPTAEESTSLDFIRSEQPSTGNILAPHYYTWMSGDQPVSVNMALEKTGLDRKNSVTNSSEHSASVTYQPGHNIIRAEFTTIFKSRSAWSKTSTGEAMGQYNFDYRVWWCLELIINFNKDAFGVKVIKSPCDENPKNFTTKIENLEIPGFHEPFENKLGSKLKAFTESTFKPSIIAACKLFASNIESSLRWISGEVDVVQFQKPILNVQGDLVVGINYAPAVKRDIIIAADLKGSQHQPRPGPIQPEDPTDTNTLLLQWSYEFAFVTSTHKDAQLTLRGLAKTDIPSGHVEVAFQSSLSKPAPFAAIRFPTATNTVVCTSPPNVEARVTKDVGIANTFRVTVPLAGIPAGGAVTVVISAATKVQSGQSFPLELKEEWNDSVGDGTQVIQGQGTLKMVVP